MTKCNPRGLPSGKIPDPVRGKIMVKYFSIINGFDIVPMPAPNIALVASIVPFEREILKSSVAFLISSSYLSEALIESQAAGFAKT